MPFRPDLEVGSLVVDGGGGIDPEGFAYGNGQSRLLWRSAGVGCCVISPTTSIKLIWLSHLDQFDEVCIETSQMSRTGIA
jgi:hypothetical protein